MVLRRLARPAAGACSGAAAAAAGASVGGATRERLPNTLDCVSGAAWRDGPAASPARPAAASRSGDAEPSLPPRTRCAGPDAVPRRVVTDSAMVPIAASRGAWVVESLLSTAAAPVAAELAERLASSTASPTCGSESEGGLAGALFAECWAQGTLRAASLGGPDVGGEPADRPRRTPPPCACFP